MWLFLASASNFWNLSEHVLQSYKASLPSETSDMSWSSFDKKMLLQKELFSFLMVRSFVLKLFVVLSRALCNAKLLSVKLNTVYYSIVYRYSHPSLSKARCTPTLLLMRSLYLQRTNSLSCNTRKFVFSWLPTLARAKSLHPVHRTCIIPQGQTQKYDQEYRYL